jgi:hypothetical protein
MAERDGRGPFELLNALRRIQELDRWGSGGQRILARSRDRCMEPARCTNAEENAYLCTAETLRLKVGERSKPVRVHRSGSTKDKIRGYPITDLLIPKFEELASSTSKTSNTICTIS